MILDQNGNVGVGTTAPRAKMEVSGGMTITGDATIAGVARMSGFQLTTSPSTGYVLTSDSTGAGSWTSVTSSQWTAATGGINYAGGNVGINTTVPRAKMEVSGGMTITGDVTIAGSLGLGYVHTAGPAFTTTGQSIVGVDSTGLVTVHLATVDMKAGRVIVIKDEKGLADSNNITVDTEGGDLIDNTANVLITAKYGVVRAYSNGSTWFTF